MSWLTTLAGSVLGPFGTIARAVVGQVGDYIKGKQEERQIERESLLRIKQAKADAIIEIIKTKGVGDIAWENTQIQNSGWKDEYWTILISTPLVLAWIPYTRPWVFEGFNAFAGMPDWYQVSVGVAVSAAFGFKKFAEMMQLKNGVPLKDLMGITEIQNTKTCEES